MRLYRRCTILSTQKNIRKAGIGVVESDSESESITSEPKLLKIRRRHIPSIRITSAKMSRYVAYRLVSYVRTYLQQFSP